MQQDAQCCAVCAVVPHAPSMHRAVIQQSCCACAVWMRPARTPTDQDALMPMGGSSHVRPWPAPRQVVCVCCDVCVPRPWPWPWPWKYRLLPLLLPAVWPAARLSPSGAASARPAAAAMAVDTAAVVAVAAASAPAPATAAFIHSRGACGGALAPPRSRRRLRALDTAR